MSQVLVLGYYFPPLGGAGVQRSVKFVQYLPDFGYESVVVTGPDTAALSWSPPDATLAAAIPTGTPVVRVPGPEPPRSGRWRGRLERWFFLRPPFSRWWTEGVVSTARPHAELADVIYASMSPFETGEAAARLAAEAGKPWVADLRDPWALDEWLVYPTAAHRRRELARMRRVLGAADAIVMNTAEATREVLRRFPELREKPVVTIPNGFDPVDFESPQPQRDDGKFRIVHAGYVHVGLGLRYRRARIARHLLGGAERGLDILPRSHFFLLAALDRLLAERPEYASLIEVHLAGVLGPADDLATCRELVHAHGYLPHEAAIDLVRSADLLFLPMHDLRPGTRARIVPGKTYEYLASGRAILAAVPDGDARDLLARSGTALLCRPADSTSMASLIARQIDLVRAGARLPSPPRDLLRRYERRTLTAALADVFDGLLARRRGAASRSNEARARFGVA